MEFEIGQKCLYLFGGNWHPCHFESLGVVNGTYWVKTGWGERICTSKSCLEPAYDNLLDKPREFSETVPADVASFAAMMIRLKHFTTTKFMEGFEHGV